MSFEITKDDELKTNLPLENAIKIAKDSLEKLGQVTESKNDFISGWIRFGLQKVKIRISWANRDGSIFFTIQSSSDDIWNSGGKSAKKRLLELIRNFDNPGIKIDRLGIHPAALTGMLCLFALVVILILKFIGV